VAATPAAVFAVLADPARYADWVVGAREIVGWDHHWPAPGSWFRHHSGVGPAAVGDHTTVLAADPPAELVLLAAFGPLGAAEVRLRVAPSATGSLVTLEERPVSGPLAAVRGARLLDLAIQARNAESLRRLRRLAEAGAQPPGRHR
jgi:uncharacterized protein YndB with AHSA1/START domain